MLAKPKNLKVAITLMYLSLVIGVIIVVYDHISTEESLDRLAASIYFSVSMFAVFVIIKLSSGVVWAKKTYFSLTSIFFILGFYSLWYFLNETLYIDVAITIVNQLISGAILVLLISKEVNEWYIAVNEK